MCVQFVIPTKKCAVELENQLSNLYSRQSSNNPLVARNVMMDFVWNPDGKLKRSPTTNHFRASRISKQVSLLRGWPFCPGHFFLPFFISLKGTDFFLTFATQLHYLNPFYILSFRVEWHQIWENLAYSDTNTFFHEYCWKIFPCLSAGIRNNGCCDAAKGQGKNKQHTPKQEEEIPNTSLRRHRSCCNMFTCSSPCYYLEINVGVIGVRRPVLSEEQRKNC